MISLFSNTVQPASIIVLYMLLFSKFVELSA